MLKKREIRRHRISIPNKCVCSFSRFSANCTPIKTNNVHLLFQRNDERPKMKNIGKFCNCFDKQSAHIHTFYAMHENKNTETNIPNRCFPCQRYDRVNAVRTMLVESLPWISVIFSIYFAYISDKMNTAVRLIHANECVKLWKSRIYRVAKHFMSGD